ncbi:hypothetical protein NEUTE1DRAFT_140637 [Neurospora tetrasperma FGSC 2508]|uniref:Chromo domain-containing protein n=1 Tax=Neurospora tetrasperma (strain FGSC 2508 / ATCC MYA-4615 / P0657) TaxID=510951 RepID=F8MX51_NEUT8|nr:uncharacterized protein NEUTE1DRAFT_140637 [Neurospora tetrasperma FGSC 2508]EGO54322.1 hypothetical protein NEUTE1DRAFT_140637 [Neurospora tetrasperma FGSC 2508]EGZ68242.1 hypothetical protein NEUTE2DRAFT_170002 [Neurospora tetrasperma FGSC 2509]
MPKRTLATARGAHSDKAALRAQGINPNKRLAGLNIRTVPQRMTAQNEPPAPGDESEEEPEEAPAEEAEEEAEEEPAAKRRKTTKAAGGKRKRASDDDDEDDEEEAEESEEPEERPRKRAKSAANKKPARKAKSPKRKNKKKASNKKAKKAKESEDESEEESEDEAYDPMQLWEVRDIIAEQVDSDGQLQYLVDWEDNPETGEKYDPTWEPAENVVDTSAQILAEWEERRARRASTEEEVSAEAVDPDDIEMEDVPEEEMPEEEERREIVQGRRRAGPKPRTQPKYPRKKLVAMTAPK